MNFSYCPRIKTHFDWCCNYSGLQFFLTSPAKSLHSMYNRQFSNSLLIFFRLLVINDHVSTIIFLRQFSKSYAQGSLKEVFCSYLVLKIFSIKAMLQLQQSQRKNAFVNAAVKYSLYFSGQSNRQQSRPLVTCQTADRALQVGPFSSEPRRKGSLRRTPSAGNLHCRPQVRSDGESG